MLTVNIICIGKLKERYWAQACEEYQKRLRAFCKCNVIELGESKLPDDPSQGQIQKGLEAEAEMILSKITGGYTVAMCIEGKQFDSVQFGQMFARVALAGHSCVNFIIGSSFGLSDRVKAKADCLLSMSKMTFPHQLARVMLHEQIYRGFQIQHNGKYHK